MDFIKFKFETHGALTYIVHPDGSKYLATSHEIHLCNWVKRMIVEHEEAARHTIHHLKALMKERDDLKKVRHIYKLPSVATRAMALAKALGREWSSLSSKERVQMRRGANAVTNATEYPRDHI